MLHLRNLCNLRIRAVTFQLPHSLYTLKTMAGSETAKRVRPTDAEERLLIEAAQDDRAQFGKIYVHYFELVYAYVSRRVRSRVATEDLTAEVFRKALQNLPRYKWTGAPFAAWLFRIASNMIADRTKRQAREIKSSEPDLIPASPTQGKQTQQIALEESERRAHLFRLVDALAEDQRRVVTMRFAEEKTIREIADKFGRTEGAVKQLQFRALTNLRKKLTTEDTEGNSE